MFNKKQPLTLLLLLPMIALAPGCENVDLPDEVKTPKKGKLEARASMPECEGKIEACSTADDACTDDDETCAEALFKCFDEVPEACFPALSEELEDIPSGWVDIFEKCFENPKLDACFQTYDACVEGGTEEQSCYETLGTCVDPLLSAECKEIEAQGEAEGNADDEEALPEESIPEDIGELGDDESHDEKEE